MSQQLLGNTSRGKLFILSAPAGTGKTTLVDRLAEEFPCVVRSISFTTRRPRGEEKEGIDYHYISQSTFKEKIAAQDFLEHVELYGNFYGTSKSWVEEKICLGLHVILVIDTQGAQKLRGKVDAAFIFVMPPSFEELKRRLTERQTETDEKIRERLEWAKTEIEVGQKVYDYVIINDSLEIAYQVLKSIVIAEEHKGVAT